MDVGVAVPGKLRRRAERLGLVTIEQMDTNNALVLDSATMSALADTTLDLRLVKTPAVRRFAAIRKSRVSRCDPQERELRLTANGVAVVEGSSIGS